MTKTYRGRVPVALAVLTMSLLPALPLSAQSEANSRSAMTDSPLAYPETRRLDLIEPQFGVDVADPYRWLEEDVRTNAEVRNWVTAENRITDRYLAGLPGRDMLRRRMKALTDYSRTGVPRKGGNRYFFVRNSGLQNQAPLYVRDGLKGQDRLLIDPNGWAKDGATALAEWRPSMDGRHLLYAVQDGGSDWRTLRVLDVDSGKVLPDIVRWVKFSDLAWDGEGRGFFYSRFPEPAAGQAFQSLNENSRVYYHRLGTDQSADRLIYETPRQPKLGHSAQVTDDGRWLVISSSLGTDDRNAVAVAALEDKDPASGSLRVKTLVKGLAAGWRLAGSVGDSLYFLTSDRAPRKRLVRIDPRIGRRSLVEIVPQQAAALEGASLVGERLILAYLNHAASDVELRDLSGRKAAEVTLNGIGTAAGFGGRDGDPETFYSFSSFTDPSTIYRLDTATGATEIFARPPLAFDPDAYVTEQVFYASKDGTKVPMFIVRRRDLAEGKRPAPTLLYGYGGFTISVTPAFSALRIAWLEQGGVLAIANLRGGGEYGEEWHDAGRLQNKQNVFDDFIAAGEYLIASGITGKGQLAVQGGSNGGLLVGAVVNQRPDLFAAANPAVGVMDMLRFDRFTAGRYWVDDYGYPSKEKDFRTLLAYSPYHNVWEGRDYPAILVTTADTDDRVVPGHSFKYAAAIQHADLGPKPRLIRIETRAGHGAGKPTDKLIEEAADVYAFLARWTGLEIRDPQEATATVTASTAGVAKAVQKP